MTNRRKAVRETLDHYCDIWTYGVLISATGAKLVAISANAKGRKVVEDRWPEVRWTKESPEPDHGWLFTIVRVMPYADLDVSLDWLTYAVASSLQAFADPERVVWRRSSDDEGLCRVEGNRSFLRDTYGDLDVEYVPPPPTDFPEGNA